MAFAHDVVKAAGAGPEALEGIDSRLDAGGRALSWPFKEGGRCNCVFSEVDGFVGSVEGSRDIN